MSTKPTRTLDPSRQEALSLPLVDDLRTFYNQIQPRPFPADMVGAKIVAVGLVPGLREAGISIDYIPKGKKVKSRVVFGYNDMGEWVKYHTNPAYQAYSDEK